MHSYAITPSPKPCHMPHKYKVDVPTSMTDLNQAPIFEWIVVWCDLKNKYHKHVCLKGIGLFSHNMITIMGSTINIIGNPCINV